MADKHKILHNIHSQVDELVKKYKNVKQNNVNLKQENIELNELLSKKSELLNKLEEEIKAIKIAKNIGTEENIENTKDLKKQLDHYIKEIDGCLAILNQ